VDQALKTKWVAALRSGDYKQGTGVLRRNDDTFCCLGVLCDIINPKKWQTEPLRFTFEEKSTEPPDSVTDAAQLDAADIGVLIGLNDARGCSFNKIAAHIEREM
jgi:hypothetical protein